MGGFSRKKSGGDGPPRDPDADLFEDGAAAGAPEAVEIPVDGTLDLHTFDPREVKPLLGDYLDACLAKGIYEVRVIHGKGTGALRRTVHALLEKDPRVASFQLAAERGGNWGATSVVLRRGGGGGGGGGGET